MAIDPGLLPPPLQPLADAIEIGVMQVDPRALGAAGALEAPLVDAGGVHRETVERWSSYVETGMVVRLDLSHAAVPPELATLLRVRHADMLGADGALYEHERTARSQLVNRAAALARLAARVAAVGNASLTPQS